MLDLLIDFNIAGWLAIGVVLLVAMIWEGDLGMDLAYPIGLIVATTPFLVNNYLGDEVIVGTVQEVSKESDAPAMEVEISRGGGSIRTDPSDSILSPYEVAIVPRGEKRLVILKNSNTVWRLKMNKREIQLQLQPGGSYRFHLHRAFLRKNILSIEPLQSVPGERTPPRDIT